MTGDPSRSPTTNHIKRLEWQTYLKVATEPEALFSALANPFPARSGPRESFLGRILDLVYSKWAALVGEAP